MTKIRKINWNGLSDKEVEINQNQYGSNKIIEEK